MTDHRSTILDAAARVFYEKGYSRATVLDIAAEAGLTKRTIYRYLGSKELLLTAVCDRFVTTRLATARQLPSATSPADQLEALVEQYVATVCAARVETRVFIDELKHISPEHLAAIDEETREHLAQFRNVIVGGARKSVFAKLDNDIVAHSVFGSILNISRWYRSDGPLTPPQLASLMSTLFLRGLRAVGSDRKGDAVVVPDRVPPGLPPRSQNDLPRPKYAGQVDSLFTAGGAPTRTDSVVAHILQVAGELFSERGYDRTSIREIADAAGLTKSAVCYYISRKEDMLYYLNLWLTEHGVRLLQEVETEDLPPAEALRRLVAVHCALVHDNLETFRVFNSEIRFLEPTAQREIIWNRDRYAYYFDNVIRRLVDADEYSASVLTVMVMGMLNSMHIWYSRDRGPERVSAVFSHLLLHGLTVPAVGGRSKHPAAAAVVASQ